MTTALLACAVSASIFKVDYFQVGRGGIRAASKKRGPA